MKKLFLVVLVILAVNASVGASAKSRQITDFNKGWRFMLGDNAKASGVMFDDGGWRMLNLPHDWSIEGNFSKDNPSTVGGGALPGGIGWYRKSFTLNKNLEGMLVSVEFDGVYMNSEVWINGHYLGKRPNGYISFQYDITPFIRYGDEHNVLAVRVDNSLQPNSRWYSGSGIYRNVRLAATNPIHVIPWGTVVTTPQISTTGAAAKISTEITNQSVESEDVKLVTTVVDANFRLVDQVETAAKLGKGTSHSFEQGFTISQPRCWSPESPILYKAISRVYVRGKVVDELVTPFGIRTVDFNSENGFYLNGKQVKINGVCLHHDLGCLGTAINKYALERQLRILKDMGCNAIRTSHNPPAPELLQLCDSLGLMVMDEAFDMWKKQKNPYDYHLFWDEWHKQDLIDQLRRDRNHPCVIMWSIGNEIPEQWNDSTGAKIALELAAIVRTFDSTRPITAACNEISSQNGIINSGALDVVGYNYNHQKFKNFLVDYPGKKFIATETVSALQSRGHYDMPSDSVRVWPVRWDIPLARGNADFTCSSYENCRTPWGSTHEETWKELKKHNFLSGGFIWTGFDYLGEPTPYLWPARSSYFGIVDLAGFPKDVYYMYQSEWTSKDVLHVFPHWNWKEGQTIDVWSYYNNADTVELFINGRSQGVKSKRGDDLHVAWRVKFEPGELTAISRKEGRLVKTFTVKTAGIPYKIVLTTDKSTITGDGYDLAYISVSIQDKEGNECPFADNLITFSTNGGGKVVGVDNGCQTYHGSLKSDAITAYNGKCIAVVQGEVSYGAIKISASAKGLEPAELVVRVQ